MYGIYGNIYHKYTPNVSINLPYMDPSWDIEWGGVYVFWGWDQIPTTRFMNSMLVKHWFLPPFLWVAQKP